MRASVESLEKHGAAAVLLITKTLRPIFFDKCKVTDYTSPVKIRNFIHKGLKRLYTEDSPKGVPPDTAEKLLRMFGFLDAMEDPEELRTLTEWKAHTMTGNRKGTVSLYVTRNRRLTFRIDATELEIYDVNLEDYH